MSKEYGKWSEEAKNSKKLKIEENKRIANEAIQETNVIIQSLEIIYKNTSDEETKKTIGKSIDKLNCYIYEQEKNIQYSRAI